MKVTFYSNFMNHHQLPFSLAMYEKLGSDYKFIATEPISEERRELGYSDMNRLYPFVITTYDKKENENIAMNLGLKSDIVLIGSAPDRFIEERIKQDKITFRYSERIYKKGLWRAFDPRLIRSILKTHTKYRRKKMYMLCASAYAAGDLSMMGAYPGKLYKWGYFTEVYTYDIDKLIKSKLSGKLEIMWCGRLIDLKHPEIAILLARYLKNRSYEFLLKIIGFGPLKNKLERDIEKYELQNFVKLLGAMPFSKVREQMEMANIFIFTSDYHEGWGAVLNEALNSGCAVVASHAIGAVPYLIKHKHNGLIYYNNDIKDLFDNVEILIRDRSLMEKLGKNAYFRMANTWNAKTAANNFMSLAMALASGKNARIMEGPCSIAKPIKQWRMYSKCMNLEI